jgi:DNA polymerase-3 subunit delta'
MGKWKVFVLGDAERLIPQLGTEVAANALLKALEEPPADSVIILTASDPNALLPTVLSRVVLVRVARLADSDVTAFAQQRLGITNQVDLSQRVTAAEGSIGKLFATSPGRSGPGFISERAGGIGGVEQAERFLNAPWLFALGQVPFQARGGFTDMLDALASKLRSEVKRGGDTEKLVEAIALVLDARDLAQGNVNPQLLAAVLAEDLQTRRAS